MNRMTQPRHGHSRHGLMKREAALVEFVIAGVVEHRQLRVDQRFERPQPIIPEADPVIGAARHMPPDAGQDAAHKGDDEGDPPSG